MTHNNTPVYWLSPLGSVDDFGHPYVDEMIDGKTQFGPWANMTPENWEIFGAGLGQRYQRQPDGRWLKVEG